MNTINVNDFRETQYKGYLVNADGDIISIKGKKPKLLTQWERHGYKRVTLCENGKQINVSVHRLVAMAFIDNPNGYNEINHKDEDKTNNNVNNLEWCSHLYNIRYGTCTKRGAETRKRNKMLRKAV